MSRHKPLKISIHGSFVYTEALGIQNCKSTHRSQPMTQKSIRSPVGGWVLWHLHAEAQRKEGYRINTSKWLGRLLSRRIVSKGYDQICTSEMPLWCLHGLGDGQVRPREWLVPEPAPSHAIIIPLANNQIQVVEHREISGTATSWEKTTLQYRHPNHYIRRMLSDCPL